MPDHIPNEPYAEGEFAGRTALVTGAGQGIGAAVATALAARGAHVVATDRSARGLEELALMGRALAGAITPRVMDVTDPAAVTSVIDGVVRDHGALDLLVNVAGILRTAPVAELTDADWADTFAVNTTGVFHTSRAAASHMTARGSGCIITVASNAAGIPRTGMAAYAASKAAATMFTKCLGLEVARSGVRCNVVAPGSTDTEMQRALWPEGQTEVPRSVVDGDPATYRTGIPLGRIAAPQDIAEAVLFLASERARHVTLQELYVDGGASLR
ncbi:2,3-dihydro-2,3-dihydroxybenzoate dehydrogenase [Streptomyces sp. BG9H]|uniref:2,3-dihydro-2,3-dihydroxybenzoate dehydrogenase n=1 Tax=Streptomyces anatolicus TaxID=2675858 RepID=A0ABS6YXC1_9ACTN|nr:2,3-dihydro-2,3-dihydroxybenzoate dehydrogenase [Streptomyces anatolicus]MBW5426095.1 2,3-dihydro-2,3-dihydroxybenzoate dehydrogenase [Streptomyces anatolicus]